MPSTPSLVPSDAERLAFRQELAAARAEVALARDEKNRFLAVMNHEFRTPMNGVLGVAELLRRQPLTEQARSFVDTIVESAETLQRLVEDALDFARGDGAALMFDLQTVAPTALLDAAESCWAHRTAEQGVRLLTAYDGDPDLRVTGDPDRLKQVLDAFIDHALHRQRDGGLVELRLRARAADGGVLLQAVVRDRGPVLEPAALARVFEPFAEDHGGGFAGRGLRLALARRAAEAMRGSVWAEAAAGEGALLGLDVCLPAAAAEAELRAPGFSEAGRSPRVLIVDDNATNRLVAAAFCEMAGCLCDSAEDGLAAVEAVKSQNFDVILMDIKMPRMDGVEATRVIRASPGPNRAVPIIALTANADADAARLYRAAGMLETVEKPIKPERLLTALALALQADRSDAEAAAAA